MEQFYFISFDNTTHALEAEEFLKSNNFIITIIPTPREVTASCGLSIKFSTEVVDKVKEFIKNGFIKINGIYYMTKSNGKRDIKRIV